jgi:formylglycine-generating enzyme required for sulfatase activity
MENGSMTSSVAIKSPSAQTSWRDADFAPSMIIVAPDQFIMGENAADKFSNDTERPAHRVTFSECFALGNFPVTVGQFRHFRPGHSPDDAHNLPVVSVNWHDAVAYCRWLTEKTARIYHLPHEAQWEFACRAGSRTPFSCGEAITQLEANFLYDENGLRVGVGQRSPAESYPPNKFGFYDFHGNVCEWVMDHWHPDYIDAPADGSAWIEAGENRRVIRGGAWDYLPSLLRNSWRDWRESDFRSDNLGFRVAAVAEIEIIGK